MSLRKIVFVSKKLFNNNMDGKYVFDVKEGK